jgi:hypothetical protein
LIPKANGAEQLEYTLVILFRTDAARITHLDLQRRTLEGLECTAQLQLVFQAPSHDEADHLAMAAPIGFSVLELLTALRKVKAVWDAFFDEFDNAPSRILELHATLDFLHSALLVSQSISQLQGVPLPLTLLHTFGSKLRECQKFIKKYRSLASTKWLRRGSAIIRYAFDGDAAKLNSGLLFEAQKLNNLTSLLQLWVPT